MSAPTERPILFSGPMVRAILDGSKTVTRRVAQTNEAGRLQRSGRQWHVDDPNAIHACPYGAPGDRLWVRETWRVERALNSCKPSDMDQPYPRDYRADERTQKEQDWHHPAFAGRWRPSIHMPRWASRITLEVTEVRVERLHQITEDEARAEGIRTLPDQDPEDPSAWWESAPGVHQARSARSSFRKLWSSINADRGFGWDTNPYVWVVRFRRIEP